MNFESLTNKYGKEARLITKGWGTPIFKVFILPYRSVTRGVICEKADTFLIITPPSHNIAELDNPSNYIFIIDQKKYRILLAEKILHFGLPIVSYGIIEQLKEG